MAFTKRAHELTRALQRRIVPELRYSQWSYEEHLREHIKDVRSWLDVGCGHQLLPAWRSLAETELVSAVPLVIGIDYDLESLRRHRTINKVVRADVSALPLRDQSFDLVTANMVVEHFTEPVTQFREIVRVLRPGGLFLFHTPNLRSYPAKISTILPNRFKKFLARILEDRPDEDVFPTHYRANTESAVREVAADSGLEVTAIHFTGSSPVFEVVPPIAALELLYLRQLMRRPALERYRQTLICVLRRPGCAGSAAANSDRADSGDRGNW